MQDTCVIVRSWQELPRARRTYGPDVYVATCGQSMLGRRFKCIAVTFDPKAFDSQAQRDNAEQWLLDTRCRLELDGKWIDMVKAPSEQKQHG